MPLGWTLPLADRLNRPPAGPPDPTPIELGGVCAIIILLFALIALMPDFDGWSPDAGKTETGDHSQEG